MTAGESPRLVNKLVGKELDSSIVKSKRRRPRGRARSYGPYLCQVGGDNSGESPPANEAAGDDGTHDVNEKMLAEAYRRGLRVGFISRRIRHSLEFLFGCER